MDGTNYKLDRLIMIGGQRYTVLKLNLFQNPESRFAMNNRAVETKDLSPCTAVRDCDSKSLDSGFRRKYPLGGMTSALTAFCCQIFSALGRYIEERTI